MISCKGTADAPATLVYYQRLVAAIHALDGRPEITIVHAQARELARNNFADRREAQASHLHPCRWCPPSHHWMSTSHRWDWVR